MKKKSYYNFILLVFIFLNEVPTLKSQNFVESTIHQIQGLALGSFDFCDVDGDLDQDLLIAGWDDTGNKRTILYLNDGSGVFFESSNSSFTSLNRSYVSFGDIDNDGDNDLFICGATETENVISEIYINDGSGDFTKQINNLIDGVYSGSAVFGDIDSDNDLDLFVSGRLPNGEFSATIYLNNGIGIFQKKVENVPENISSVSSTFEDVDNDEDLDLLLYGSRIISGISDTVREYTELYINNGSGDFSKLNSQILKGNFQGHAEVINFNGDEHSDIIVIGAGSTSVYINDGNLNFSEILFSDIKAGQFSSIEVGDIDNNNFDDIVISGVKSSGNSTELYINGGFNDLELKDAPFIGVRFGHIMFTDIDSDNDYDLLISGNSISERATKLYINTDEISSTKTQQLFKNDIIVFPNPANSYVTIKLQSIHDKVVCILSEDFKRVNNIIPQTWKGINEVQFDLSNLQSGLYYVLILIDGNPELRKLVKS